MFVIRARDLPETAYQPSLLAAGSAEVPKTLGPVQRIDLGQGAWVDWAPDWLPGSDQWFEAMAQQLPWAEAERPMYERMVSVPRLICSFESPHDDRIPLDLLRLRPVLEAAYGRSLPRIGANWYRNGQDSVAFHADKVPHPSDALIAIIAVGERRPFMLRPMQQRPEPARRDTDVAGEARASRRFSFGRGDLLVMGGATQAHWEHAVPKLTGPNTRISLMFRG